jgi:hypothetical protein
MASELVGKRIQVVLTLGTHRNGGPAFEAAATEIDSGAVKTLDAHTAMQLAHRAVGMYMQILATPLQEQDKPQILIPTGPVSGLRGN